MDNSTSNYAYSHNSNFRIQTDLIQEDTMERTINLIKYLDWIFELMNWKRLSGNKYVVGKNIDGTAIAIAGHDGILTMETHKEILDEVKALGLTKPINIYGYVNSGPNGSPSYIFHQVEV